MKVQDSCDLSSGLGWYGTIGTGTKPWYGTIGTGKEPWYGTIGTGMHCMVRYDDIMTRYGLKTHIVMILLIH